MFFICIFTHLAHSHPASFRSNVPWLHKENYLLSFYQEFCIILLHCNKSHIIFSLSFSCFVCIISLEFSCPIYQIWCINNIQAVFQVLTNTSMNTAEIKSCPHRAHTAKSPWDNSWLFTVLTETGSQWRSNTLLLQKWIQTDPFIFSIFAECSCSTPVFEAITEFWF